MLDQDHTLQGHWFANVPPPFDVVEETIRDLGHRSPVSASDSGQPAVHHVGVVGIRRLSMDRYGRRTSTGGGPMPHFDDTHTEYADVTSQ